MKLILSQSKFNAQMGPCAGLYTVQAPRCMHECAIKVHLSVCTKGTALLAQVKAFHCVRIFTAMIGGRIDISEERVSRPALETVLRS